MKLVCPARYSAAALPSRLRAAPAKNRIWSAIGGISPPPLRPRRFPGVRDPAAPLPPRRRAPRLAGVAGPGRPRLLGVLLDRTGGAQQRPGALPRRRPPPALERPGRHRVGPVDVLRAGDRRRAEHLTARRIHQIHPTPLGGIHRLSADEVAQNQFLAHKGILLLGTGPAARPEETCQGTCRIAPAGSAVTAGSRPGVRIRRPGPARKGPRRRPPRAARSR